MKGNDYMYEAKNVSAVLGRDSDVRVVFEGDGAYTDGKNIVLPSIESEQELDEFSVKVARGYVDHEAAHVKWTDTKQWATAVNRFKRSKENVGLKAATMNALEDVRIEKKLIDLYAGSKDNLEAVAQSVLTELTLDLEEKGREIESLDAVEIGGLAATWYGRMKGGYGDAAGELFNRLDGELKGVVKKAIDSLDDAVDTKDVSKIAEAFADELVRLAGEKDEKEEEEQKDGEDKQGGTGEEDEDKTEDKAGDEGEDDGDGDGESDGDEDDGEDDSQIGSEGKNDDGRGDSKQTGDEANNTDVSSIDRGRLPTKSEPYDPDELKAKAVKRELNKNAGGTGDKEFRRFSDRYDREVVDDELFENVRQYDELLDATVGQTNVLRRTLERKLAAKMMRSWVGGQTKGRLDSRRLVGAVTGSANVYKTREESADLDTALMILVDHSGSMAARISTAAKATVALAVALENTPIAYAIQGFTTELLPDKIANKFMREDKARLEFESFMPVMTLRYKEFNDRLVRVRGKLGGMEHNFCNNRSLNVDGVSVQKAGRELLNRPEKRKVLMVLSDGEPHDGYSLVEGGCEEHLKNVVLGLASVGVEVFGIGIESDAVSSYYPDYAVLNDVADLEKEVIGRMEGLLIGGGRHVRKAS